MRVLKRNGDFEPVSFDKVLARIDVFCKDLKTIDPHEICQKVCGRIYDGVPTTELDELTAQLCGSMITENPEYGVLSSRITVSNHHKNTSPSFSETVGILYAAKDSVGAPMPLVSDELYEIVQANKEKLNSVIDYERDYGFDYFGFKTLERSYLLKVGNRSVERPQHMWMRVALGIHSTDIKDAIETYDLLSRKYFCHATPTLFNAGTRCQQFASCFLIAMQDDSIEGIYNTLKQAALISKYSGGIGLHIHNVRSTNSLIRGTNGKSTGIIPMLRVFNDTARYVNQCFAPETIVYSRTGPKRVDEVKPLDHLVTIDGTFKRVNQVAVSRVNKEILLIHPRNALAPIRVTKEHQIYAMKTRSAAPDYISACELTCDSFVGYPIPRDVIDSLDKTTFFEFYGIMLAYGDIDRDTGALSINFNSATDTTRPDLVIKYLTQNRVAYKQVIDYTGTIQFTFDRTSAIKLQWSDLYSPLGERRPNPAYMNLNTIKIYSILSGMMNMQTHTEYYTRSYVMAMSVRYLFLRLGKLANISMSPDGQYKLTVDESLQFVYNGIIWTGIKSIASDTYSGCVYDFNMQNNHNYLTDMGLVHNSGKRNGSIAMYLEPWHADIFDFLDIRKNNGADEIRSRDLFTALWIPDLFMERVESGGMWSLMCPDECKGLSDCHSDAFRTLYTGYEAAGKFRRQVKAKDLWLAILTSQIETGTPYMLYKDAANNKSNQKNLGTIKSSNLCVAPETLVLTSKGHLPIKELAETDGGHVEVWNGNAFSKTIVRQTGVAQPLLTVSFDNGSEVRCTPYHKFFIETGKVPSKGSVRTIVEAKDLTVGMKIVRFEIPTINLPPPPINERLKHPYTQGLFAADGTYETHTDEKKHRCKNQTSDEQGMFCKRHVNNVAAYEDEGDLDDLVQCHANSWDDKPMLWLYGEKKKLLPHVDWLYFNEDVKNDRLNLALPHDMANKNFVPINHDIDTKLRWLEGYLDGDGCVLQNNGAKIIQVSCINKEFFKDVKYLLQTLGVEVSIKKSKDAGTRMMPDGRGGSKEYMCATIWRFSIGLANLLHLVDLGFSPKRLALGELPENQRLGQNRFIRIAGVVDSSDIDDTYCFTEPLEHAGVFNGVLLGQCSEIIEMSSPTETATCNLASMVLPTYVENGIFNFEKLHKNMGVVVKNINKIIDRNMYPIEETRHSNLLHRPIGIGVQGLSDVFMLLRLPYDSPEAARLNKEIFETMYHGALEASMELSKKRAAMITTLDTASPVGAEAGAIRAHLALIPEEAKMTHWRGAYSSFAGSPASEGLLQFDLWKASADAHSGRYDWTALKTEIKAHGLRNSLLLAPMPTASTSQIMGYTESFEPPASNFYQRRTLAGEFIVCSKYLVGDLIKLGLWNTDMKNKILVGNGSIQHIPEIPADLKALYKTVWEIKQRVLIDLSAGRGVYIDQSQSLNLYVEDPDFAKLTNMHFYSWKSGLKTGLYYLRSRPRAKTAAYSLDPSLVAAYATDKAAASASASAAAAAEPALFCTRDNPDCMMCSS